MSQRIRTCRFVYLIVRLLVALIPAANSRSLEWTEPTSIANSNKLAGARSLSAPSQGSRLEADRQALDSWARLLEYDGLAQRWRNESTASSPCDWAGVLCGDWEGELRVVELNFSRLFFLGPVPMPRGLGKLPGLLSLVLGVSSFEGSIPSDIGNCSNLEVLDISSNFLYDNHLPGEIFAGCRNLRILNASDCCFQGPVPDKLWSCTNIEEINLAGNNFTGNLAIGTGRQLSNLTKLDVSRNQLSGDISNVIDAVNCAKLAYIDLSSNNFAGVIPPELGKCSQLRYIMFHSNQLTGSIPEELGELQHLECLGLGKNFLTGTLPENLRQCRSLWAIDVSENDLSGGIPRWLSEMPSLQYFAAHTNNILGQTPRELARAPKLVHFDVGTNNLSGVVPPELGNVTTLRFLRLAENHLVSSLPSALGNLSHLRGLDMSANDLSGPIPPSFGSLQNLRWLHLEENRLNGSIPPELANCRSLLWLNVGNNRLSGEIPRHFFSLGNNASRSLFTESEVDEHYDPPRSFGYCSLIQIWFPEKYFASRSLQPNGLKDDAYCRELWVDELTGKSWRTLLCYWQLSHNSLSGTIPEPIRPTPFLLCLMLSHNALTGSIPENISLVPLYIIDLAANGISGSIPDVFAPLAKTLESLDFSENNLEGRFPSSLNKLAFLQKYNFSFNLELEGPVPHEGSPFWNFNPNAYLNNLQLCRARDPHSRRNDPTENPAPETMSYCDDVGVPLAQDLEPGSAADATKLSDLVLDNISIPGFVLGAGLGLFLMCIVYDMYCFTSSRRRRAPKRRRDDRVGVWQPPT